MLSKISAWFSTKTSPVTTLMATDEVRLPPDLPNWALAKQLLQDLQGRLISDNISDQETGWFMQTVYNTIQSDRQCSGTVSSQLNRLKSQIQSNVKKKLDQNCLWFGMLKYLRKISREDREAFLYTTLPGIIDLALEIEDCRPAGPLHFSKQQKGSDTKLSRQFVCSIVACFFLCLFPERKRETSSIVNIVNFTAFFKHLPLPSQIAKLQCILHYFECVLERRADLKGDIVFSRKVVPLSQMTTFDELSGCDLKLCPLSIHIDGVIEDSGAGAIQVDFANMSIGGGVLGRSRVQEEIRFSICPELMAAMLFMENMQANEAILISGFEQFSCYTGYADSLEFAGHYSGDGQVHTLVALDAVSYRGKPLIRQYEESAVLRDLNKALIGFSRMAGTSALTVSAPTSSGIEDERNGAVDVAADMVTSAMTDALRQAAENPVSPEHPQAPLEEYAQLSNQLQTEELSQTWPSPDYEEHRVYPSLQEQRSQAAEDSSVDPSSYSLHLTQVTRPSDTAEPVTHGPEFSPTTFHGSGNSAPQPAHFPIHSAFSSSSASAQSSNVAHVSVDSSLVSQPLLPVHSKHDMSTTASSSTAQISLVSSQSVSVEQHQQLPAQAGAAEQRKSLQPSLPSEHLPYAAVLNSESQSQHADLVASTTAGVSESADPSAFRDAQLPPLPFYSSHERHFASDLLGNLKKIPTAYSDVPSHRPPFSKSDRDSGDTCASKWPEALEIRGGQTVLHTEHASENVTDSAEDIVIDLPDAQKSSMTESLTFTLPKDVDPSTTKSEAVVVEGSKPLEGDYKCEDFVEAIDVVLSLPAWQSSLERAGSGMSNLSTMANVDSLSLSTNSAEEENNKRPTTEVLYVNVEDNSSSNNGARLGARATSFDSMLLEPPLSSSPQSSVSSTNLSPNTSFVLPEPDHHEPLNGSSDVHVTADFFIPGIDGTNGHVLQAPRRGSRDFYGELRDFLSSSSSGSRGSGSGGGPLSSTNSSWGSRSGSISSHGTNGSTNDFMEFWSHFRRRSSQMSDATSRRSSSSKHSSDFSTDLEEISEGSQKHSHGVIEEEGGVMSVLADFAAHFASAAVKNGVTTGAHLTAVNRHHEEEGVPEERDSLKRVTECVQEPEVLHEDSSGGLSKMSKKKSVTRAGTLVRQKEVSLEQEDLVTATDLKLPSEEYLQDENHRLESSVQVAQTGCDSDIQKSSPLDASSSVLTSATVVSSTSRLMMPIPFKPVVSKSDMPHISVRHFPLDDKETLSQSVDSGFVSAKSSVTSLVPAVEVAPVTPETRLSFTASTSTVRGKDLSGADIKSVTPSKQLHKSAEQKRHEAEGEDKLSKKPKAEQESIMAKPNIPFSQPEPVALYATLESKTIYLPSEHLPEGGLVPSDDKQIEGPSTVSEPSPSLQQQSADSSEALNPVEARAADSKEKIPKLSFIPVSSKSDSAKIKKQEHRSIQKGGRHVEVIERQVDSLAVSCRPSSSSSAQALSSGASRSSKPTGIPKHRDRSKKSDNSKASQKSTVPMTTKDTSQSKKDKKSQGALSSVHKSAKIDELLFRPHKSRYVFSDVAAPLSDKKKKTKTSESSTRKQHHGTSKVHDERKERHRGERKSKSFIKSPKFIRFVNSLAEISLSQAVLEGAEILSQSPASQIPIGQSQEEVSDEVYMWFASRIVNEVFLHVINNMETLMQDQGSDIPGGQPQAQEIGASHITGLCTEDLEESLSVITSRSETAAAGPAVPKLKSILPSKSDTAASCSKGSGQLKPSGSLKMVKFKESHKEEKGIPVPTQVPASSPSKTNAIPTFQRQSSSNSSSIPVPTRRKSSLDLPSTSPPAAGATSISSTHSSEPSSKPSSTHQSHATESSQPGGTASLDLSVDVYQAAATIVNQVFQTISDRMDVQALSPGSSGPHGTASSVDTGVHSTGSRIHSHYDSISSNIFSSSPVKTSESPKRARRSVSPSIGIFSRKPMSRETLTSAFLKVDSTPHIKSYERRSSEPCQTSVQLSLQAFNSIKFTNKAVEDKQRKISRTDDDIGRGRTWRRGSLDGFSFERRNSCGFKDPVLSRFAEELMKADTSVPELVIVGSHPGSSSTGSRRSSVSAFRDTTLANFESELLNTSFTSGASLSQSHSPRSQQRRSHLDRSRSRESGNWKSDSSDTEYWFPPPKFVGNEFQQEYNRQHSQEELQEYASFFAGRVVQEAVCMLKCDPEYMSKEEQDVDMFAENLTDQIMRDALLATVHDIDSGSHLVTSHGEEELRRFLEGESLLMVKQDEEVEDEKHSYFGKGARPKTKPTASSGSIPTSLPRTIPRRKGVKRTDPVEEQWAPGSDSSHLEVREERKDRYTTLVSAKPFQQYSYRDPQPTPIDWGGARPKQFKVSHQEPTAAKSSSSKLKRHSSIPSASSSLSPRWKPQSSSLQVPAWTSHQHHRREQALRVRSMSDSASGGASSIPIYGESVHSSNTMDMRRSAATQGEESSVQSSAFPSLSFPGESVESYVLSSSSGSEGRERPDREAHFMKQMVKREHTSKASHLPQREQRLVAGSEAPSSGKERSRRDFHSKKALRREVHGRHVRDRRSRLSQDSGQNVEASAVIDEFAAQMSSHIVECVLMHCRENRLLRFLSYHQPIATGNWGCGAYQGNAQLKMVIQWLAASVGQAPALMYYTFNDQRMLQAQEIGDLLSGWTVGQLATTLRDYCNWVRVYLSSSSPSSSSGFSPSALAQIKQQRPARPGGSPAHSAWQDEHDSQLPQTLFDFLQEKCGSQKDREDTH